MGTSRAADSHRNEYRGALHRALRTDRVAWQLALAMMVGFFALPWLVQELYLACQACHESFSYFDVDLISLDLLWFGSRACPRTAIGSVLLVLAAVLPRWWQARILRRTTLPVVAEVAPPTDFTYRVAPERCMVAGKQALLRLRSAYLARLGATLLFLWPALFLGARHALLPSRWYGTVGGSGSIFAGPQEYLPIFIVAALILLTSSPSRRNVLGRFTEDFESGRIKLDEKSRGLSRLVVEDR
jgi:hypothetical protein